MEMARPDDPFNLPAPPGFRGLHPDLPVSLYCRRLPHWRQSGASYFVTFRLADALPQEKIDLLNRMRSEWQRSHPKPTEEDWDAYAREVTQRTEAWSDESFGACWFSSRVWSEELSDRLLHFQGQRYHMGCFAIMPNHCHLVMRPFDGFELENLLQSTKSLVAKKIHSANGTSGRLWQEESYDRIIRDEEHLWRVVQYIGRNPAQAGLPRESWVRWIAPDWHEAGWDFVDAD
jgi:hypothetical protein